VHQLNKQLGKRVRKAVFKVPRALLEV